MTEAQPEFDIEQATKDGSLTGAAGVTLACMAYARLSYVDQTRQHNTSHEKVDKLGLGLLLGSFGLILTGVAQGYIKEKVVESQQT